MDPDVLKELPESIQLELRNTSKAQLRERKEFGLKIRGTTQKREIVIPRTARVSTPELGGKTLLKEILDLLDDWIAKDGISPSPAGIEELSEYLDSLIDTKEIDKAWKILSYFGFITQSTSSKGKGRKEWSKAYKNLFERINGRIVEMFGCPFKEIE
jgi:hypothetical protein